MLRLSIVLLSVAMLGINPMSIPNKDESSKAQPAELPSFTVIGPFVRTTNAVEMSGSEGKIGPLWNQFMHGGAEPIPGVIDEKTIYAVYTGYESDANGAYDLILGKSVQPQTQAPVNMKAIHIPAARYLVFSAAGSSPDAIKAAWMNIYGYFAHQSETRRAFTFDSEQHSDAGTKIFIAVR